MVVNKGRRTGGIWKVKCLRGRTASDHPHVFASSRHRASPRLSPGSRSSADYILDGEQTVGWFATNYSHWCNDFIDGNESMCFDCGGTELSETVCSGR